jgi:hypothetical protein
VLRLSTAFSVINQWAAVPDQLGAPCRGCAAPNKRYDADNPDVVTLTLGADDIDFGNWIQHCYADRTACNKASNTKKLTGQLAAAKANLRLVFNELNRRAGLDHKKVLVVATNYYDPYQIKYAKCVDTNAFVVHKIWPWIGITQNEQYWIQDGKHSGLSCCVMSYRVV